MALKIIVCIVFLIAAVLIFAAFRPNTIRVQRSIVINAPPGKVFTLINDFHNWSHWAPQDREDPSMKRTYSGPIQGVGAISEWTSGGSAGKGRMLITESLPESRIAIKVDFVKPFDAHNTNEFALEPAGNSTTVTWTMQGSNLYILKLMGIFVNMDRMMGKHFETGLNNLKSAAEQ